MRTPSKNNLAEPMIQVFIYRHTSDSDYCLSMQSDMMLPLVSTFLVTDTLWEVSLGEDSLWIYRDTSKSLTCTPWDEWLLRPLIHEPVGAAFPLVVRRNDLGELVCNNRYADLRTRTFQMLVQRSCVNCFGTFASRSGVFICETCVWFSDQDTEFV